MMKMLMKLFTLCFISFLLGDGGVILRVDDQNYSLHEFFSRYPKKQWERADSLQKEKMFSDFTKRHLCILEAKKMGLHNDPYVAVKIRDRSQQILVNESYEYFVARPLIPQEELDLGKKYAKKELFAHHILIGHSNAYLGNPPKRTLDEAFVLSQQIKGEFDDGEDFEALAEKYSDDPGALNNFGSLGWVQWGATVPEFQFAAFALGVGEVSVPVLTDFGYHLILITDVRPSENQYLDDDAYEDRVVSLSKNSIRNLLQPAALKYDSLIIINNGVIFNMDAIQIIYKSYERLQKEGSFSSSNKVDPVVLLEAVGRVGVVCVFGKKGYGPKWFARKLVRIPTSRRPGFGSAEDVLSVFRTIILQNIAVKDGLSGGVDASFIYKQRHYEMVSELLYDAYLKYLVVSAEKPDTSDVINYYDKNKNKNYMEKEKVVLRVIKVDKRGVADSLLLLVNSGTDFLSLAQQNSLINPEKGGLYGPFPRNQNSSFFDASSLLEIGGFSPVLLSSNNTFSIVQLVERVSPSPFALDRVYTQIESLLLKEAQAAAKKEGVDGLFKKYVINKNMSLLN